MVRSLPDDVPYGGRNSQRLQGRLKVGKLNVDENNGTAARYQVRGIPMLLLFKGGKVVDQRVGPWANPKCRR